MATPRISRVFGAVNMGSFRISAMIAGISETGEMIVLGSGHRASQGIKRGYVTDMIAATYAVYQSLRAAALSASMTGSTPLPWREALWVRLSGEAVQFLTFTGPFLAEPAKAPLGKTQIHHAEQASRPHTRQAAAHGEGHTTVTRLHPEFVAGLNTEPRACGG